MHSSLRNPNQIFWFRLRQEARLNVVAKRFAVYRLYAWDIYCTCEYDLESKAFPKLQHCHPQRKRRTRPNR